MEEIIFYLNDHLLLLALFFYLLYQRLWIDFFLQENTFS